MPAEKFAFSPVTLLVGLGIMSLCEGKDLACNQLLVSQVRGVLQGLSAHTDV